MANPQKENGSTMIANEVLEMIYGCDLKAREMKVLLFVIRKTWGWHKKEDTISYGQIVKACNIDRRSAVRGVKELEEKNILIIKKGYINEYKFNKNYDEWVGGEKTLLGGEKTLVSNDPLPSVKQPPTLGGEMTLKLGGEMTPTKYNKYNITKETITKESTFSKIKDLNEFDLEEISTAYSVPISFVASKLDDLQNYCESTGKRYRNYKSALRNWVKKDAIKIRKEEHGKSKIVFIE